MNKLWEALDSGDLAKIAKILQEVTEDLKKRNDRADFFEEQLEMQDNDHRAEDFS